MTQEAVKRTRDKIVFDLLQVLQEIAGQRLV